MGWRLFPTTGLRTASVPNPTACVMEYLLAPLDGLTDWRYRQAYAETIGGLSRAIAPFVTLVAGRVVRLSHLRDLWPENNTAMQVEPQILGNEEAYFPAMATALRHLGYDTLNWNLGCPIRSVAAKRRGSGLLPHGEQIDRFLNKACAAQADMAMSVKIRLGYRDRDEIWPLLEVFNRYPLRYVAIHPRTGVQGYGGEPDLDFLERILPQVQHRVYYSGNIFTVSDAERLQQRFPSIDTCLLGRGVLSDPLLPLRLRGEGFSAEEARSKCIALMQALYENHEKDGIRPVSILKRMKGYWVRLNHQLYGLNDEWIIRLKKVNTEQDYAALVKEYGNV